MEIRNYCDTLAGYTGLDEWARAHAVAGFEKLCSAVDEAETHLSRKGHSNLAADLTLLWTRLGNWMKLDAGLIHNKDIASRPSQGRLDSILSELNDTVLSALERCDYPTHSLDFRLVCWWGESYSFTARQARAVKVLWDAWKTDTPDVCDETLLFAVDDNAPPRNIRDLFRNKPAWGSMIVGGDTKGTHRLKDPQEDG